MKSLLLASAVALALTNASMLAQSSGPYSNVFTGVNAASIASNAWATSATFTLPADGTGGFGAINNVLGAADAAGNGDQSAVVFSLGNGGSATLSFANPIFNGAGADFAVFENVFDFFGNPQTVTNTGTGRLTTAEFSGSFNASFLELGFVEVTSDGVTFARFPSTALTNESGRYFDQFGRDFLGIDPTDIHNLAGKNIDHPFASSTDRIGTPFDLAALSTDPLVLGGLVNLNAITAIRIVDVKGDGSTTDSSGRPIFDPHGETSNLNNVGVDLDAIGAIHTIPEPGAGALLLLGLVGVLLRRR